MKIYKGFLTNHKLLSRPPPWDAKNP